MATLDIKAPDGKTVSIDVPEGTDPSKYDSIVDEVMQDYMANAIPALKTDLTPSSENADVTEQGNRVLHPLSRAGDYVEAGGAGIGDIVTGKGLPQAAATVEDVLAGEKPETTSGKVGKFVGSFFTPTQIAMQAAGAKYAPAITKGLGKAATGVSKMIARPTEAALPTTEKAASEVIGALTGAEPEALQQVMVNAPAVKGAASYPQLAEQMAGSMNKLSTHVGDLEKVANATLSAEKMMSTQPMLDAIAVARKGLGEAALPEVNAVKDTLDTLAMQIKGKGGAVAEAEMAEWVKSLQKGINWNDPMGTARNEALSKVQGIVNEFLKSQNPAYEAAEAKLAEAIGLKNGLANAMGVTKEPGKAWAAKDVAVTKLKGLMNPENKASTIKMLKELAKVPGAPDFVKAVEQTAAKESINAPATGVHKMLGLGTRLPALGGVLAGLVPGAEQGLATALPYAFRSVPPAANVVYQGLRK